MSVSDLELARHIWAECSFIMTHAQGKTKDLALEDKLLTKALERSIEIIGEASKKITAEFKSIYPHIEWKKMAGTRDHLIHHYFGTDYDILWDIVENKIPE
jgi:uncharacterized protein with HEPN domain